MDLVLDLEPIALHEQLLNLDRMVSQDAAGMAEFGGFYGQASVRLAPLLGPDRRAWLVRCDGVAVGFIDADNVAGGAQISYFVSAAHRGCGIARRAVMQLVSSQKWPGVEVCIATIDDTNAASVGVAKAAGFRMVGRNSFGESVWEYRPEGDGSFSANF